MSLMYLNGFVIIILMISSISLMWTTSYNKKYDDEEDEDAISDAGNNGIESAASVHNLKVPPSLP